MSHSWFDFVAMAGRAGKRLPRTARFGSYRFLTLMGPSTLSNAAFALLAILAGCGVKGSAAGPFNPTSDVTLPAGSYSYTRLTIPAGVTVTVQGDATFAVAGDIQIAGALVGDCAKVGLEGQGSIAITGKIDNRCSADSSNAGDLLIHTRDGKPITIGTLSTPAVLESSGNVDITNDPTLQESDFDVLPSQRSATPLAPVCSATSSTLTGVALPGFPATVGFRGNGAAPNGGPVTYRWEFGDGASSADRNPLHSFANPGAYDVVLTVTDKASQTCAAKLRILIQDLGANVPAPPAASADSSSLVVASGTDVSFVATAVGLRGKDLSFAWDFGDSATSTAPALSHAYARAGRYDVNLTVRDADGNASGATLAIYIFPAPVPPSRAGALDTSADCSDAANKGVLNVHHRGGAAGRLDSGNGGFGGHFKEMYKGDVVLGGGTLITAQGGGDGQDRTGKIYVRGGAGGDGGALEILADGRLTICSGAGFGGGRGGNGGKATANSDTGDRRTLAVGGESGQAGLLKISATEISWQASVSVTGGRGGSGGNALAVGAPSSDSCDSAFNATDASAIGGVGGKGSRIDTLSGKSSGTPQVGGGAGGDGGDAKAVGGHGGNREDCGSLTRGGNGGHADASSGEGGDAFPPSGIAVQPGAFAGGNGGQAEATSGDGGRATTTPLKVDACGVVAAQARAGFASFALASGRRGGHGNTDGTGGNAIAIGGRGGNARATSADCETCAGTAGKAVTAGGDGGNADALVNSFGTFPGRATATAGDGGDAFAQGGKGGPCASCPAGMSASGGAADSTGGAGGEAGGDGGKTPGNGGKAYSTGGIGGKGATCCNPPQQGGSGGTGGAAVSHGGAAGKPGGVRGDNGIKGGDGGSGGDGNGPGSGGTGGPGSGDPNKVPNGQNGASGNSCPVSFTTLTPGGNNDSIAPAALSLTGASTAFSSLATNLVTPPTTQQDVFKSTISVIPAAITGSPQISLVSVTATGAEPNGTSGGTISISKDGRYMSYRSFATNLPGPPSSVFVRDTCKKDDGTTVTGCTPATYLGSATDSGAAPNNGNLDGALSGDGVMVCFSSASTNVVAGVTTQGQVYCHNSCGGPSTPLTGCTATTFLVSKNSSGTGASNSGFGNDYPVVSFDGRFVCYRGSSTDLVAGLPASTPTQFYCTDTCHTSGGPVAGCTQKNILVSQGNDGKPCATACTTFAPPRPAMSDDGRFVVFNTEGSVALLPNDTNNKMDVYLRDTCRTAGGPVTSCTPTTSLISLGTDGNSANGDSQSSEHSISADGRFVVFDSLATNLITGGNPAGNYFVRDTCGGSTGPVAGCTPKTVMIPVDSSVGVPAGGSSITGDGHFVVFSVIEGTCPSACHAQLVIAATGF